jgi:hypothetical protein
MPITAARRMYSPATVRPIPNDRAITRALTPQAYLKRRTSRTFRIDNLSAGIGPSPCSNRKGMTLPGSDCRQRAPLHPINRVAAFVRNRWPLSVGLGGRFPSESVAALPRIPHAELDREGDLFRNRSRGCRCDSCDKRARFRLEWLSRGFAAVQRSRWARWSEIICTSVVMQLK